MSVVPVVDEIIPFCGVQEALLLDRGMNLHSHLMQDACELLGIKKLNTTAYHPQCDGIVERYNRTFKTALKKHATRFGTQWDRLLSGVVWAYCNTPMNQHMKCLLICCLDLTAGLGQKQHFYHLQSWKLQTWLGTGNS